jgi:hypothetical protein
MKHEYQRIITLLAEDVVDYKAVALFVAKHYPETFLRAVGGKRTPEEIANECISNGETRIECIKKIRTEHSNTLREAKELTDRYYGPYRPPSEQTDIMRMHNGTLSQSEADRSAQAEQDYIEEQWKEE